MVVVKEILLCTWLFIAVECYFRPVQHALRRRCEDVQIVETFFYNQKPLYLSPLSQNLDSTLPLSTEPKLDSAMFFIFATVSPGKSDMF